MFTDDDADAIIRAAQYLYPRPEGIPVGGAHEKKPHQVYVLKDKAGAVLYVGVTSNLKARVKDHRTRKPWWGDVAETTTSAPMPWVDALNLEEHLIRELSPLHNVRKRNGSLHVNLGIRELVAKERADYRADLARRKAAAKTA